MKRESVSRLRCHRPQQTLHSIEYEISDSQLSFLLLPSLLDLAKSVSVKDISYSYPTLITFPSNVTLKQILDDNNFIQAVSERFSSAASNKHENKARIQTYFELQGKILNGDVQFSSIKSKEELLMHVNDTTQINFHQSKDNEPTSAVVEKCHEDIYHRLPVDDGERPKTAKHLVYPNESLDLLFDTLDGQVSYVTTYLQSHFGELHEFTVYPIQKKDQLSKNKQWEEWETGIFRMRGDTDGTIIIALASDWGAGTLESALVASAMVNGLDLTVQQTKATPNLPHYTIHLGDIYYVGLPSEIEHCCLGVKPHWADRGVRWPIGQHGSFTIPGNHELYSRGFGYWDYFLPRLGLFNPKDLTKPEHPQTTSYWVLENEQWRIIGLDTGYDSFSLLTIDNFSIKLPPELMDWLKNVVGLSPQMTDKRGIIFFSHHQIISAWDKKPATDFPEQIASLLPEGRTVLYLWGHEHRLSFYDKQTILMNSNKSLTFYGRCVGNSGFPTLANKLPTKARETKLLFYDDRLYHFHDNQILPDLAVGFNGFATMTFFQPKQSNDTSLYITYKSLALDEAGQLTHDNPTLLVNEEWSVDINGNVCLNKLEPVNPELTKATHNTEIGDGEPILNKSSCCTTL